MGEDKIKSYQKNKIYFEQKLFFNQQHALYFIRYNNLPV